MDIEGDDDIGGYVPLERPSCSTETMDLAPGPVAIVYSDDDTQNQSSSDDSDDMLIAKNTLKRKLPIEPIHPARPVENPAKKKKYSVWSDILQEEAIEDQFVDTKFFGSACRGNESYNYRMKYFVQGNANPYSKDWNKNSDTEPRRKIKTWTKHRATKKPLVLPDLMLTEEIAVNLAVEIAKNLNEPKSELIERVVNSLGKEKAVEIYNQTKEAEQNGGILTLNGNRRRTSGGVYLKFVKDQKLSRKDYDAIFNQNDNTNKNTLKPKKRRAKSKMTKDSEDVQLKELWELPNQSEESDTYTLKNPPPSPVYQVATSPSTNPFSFPDHFSPTSPVYCTSPSSVPLMSECNSDSPAADTFNIASSSCTDKSPDVIN